MRFQTPTVKKMARFNVSVKEQVEEETIFKFKKLMLTDLFYKNISINELAKMSGVTSERIRAFKHNTHRNLYLGEIVKIAKVLEIDLNELKGE